MWFSHSMETTAPPGRVWEVWTDVERWPTWDVALRDASLDADGGTFEEGAHGRVTLGLGRAVPVDPSPSFVVTELDPVRSYAYDLQFPLARLVVRRSLHSHDGGTSFTHEVWCEGPLGGLLSRTVGRRYRRTLPDAMDHVRERAEALPATGSSTDTA
ncbi:SRPBCC family protein [Halomarina salina]|uniref:SRPBCC family protein n=1 Tax=Halomarina salina TaxID=1872699 RepID=A0ABD5RPX2_9EURY|nr:SRPBCC family protein [Halomarina salina]